MGAAASAAGRCLACADAHERVDAGAREAAAEDAAAEEDVELEVAGLLGCNDALPAAAYAAVRERLARDDARRRAFARVMARCASAARARRAARIATEATALTRPARPAAVPIITDTAPARPRSPGT